ncbi:apolipoprotein N-acyltransferase [Hymenobacter busanensis]|uniref:Apolipoprotein N-acyltransferase n=1 Tax=Hymenobacter busanensis TaxID=2607656 RepID=A0A7L4ZYX0_9BACT|nr:apolipoprotein N-acyltransferase [Hymenobacter busanensis]KAA9333068.1 apolipoprotein N-acyltransferase [Hymenobacter busanensis]QHJ08257.1 apolipoprotein N-acyltransferase [Hymenobacter busanensis]
MLLSFKDFANKPLVLALLGPVLLWAGWPVHPAPAPLLLLVGLVPLLRLEQVLRAQGARAVRFWRWSYLYLLVWNVLTTYWVAYSTLGGGIAANVLNAALQSLPLLAFWHTKRLAGPRWGYLSFVVYWLAFEQLHLSWDLSWPWLTLGNAWAMVPGWVQWYEYTGQLGGSLWALLSNLTVFGALFGLKSWPAGPDFDPLVVARPSFSLGRWAVPFAAVVLPLLISFAIGARWQEKGPAAEVVVVQPNIDPFQEKFEGGAKYIPAEQQLNRLVQQTESALTPNTRLVLWPETALEETHWENSLSALPDVRRVQGLVAAHPGLRLITGITTVGSYPSKEAASPTARFRDDLGYYDVFNAALHVGSPTAPLQTYHKSKLVPGVEKVPGWLNSALGTIDLGGVVGSYGSQDQRTVFRSAAPATDSTLRVAPVICYESIYSDYVSEYVRNGATLIGIITNDGWWSDSPGYKQHLTYGRLRAIETRRDIARAANTGISGFINQRGDIVQQTGWWVPAVSRYTVHLNDELTFYTRHGELLGHAAQVLAVLLIGFAVVRRFVK